MPYEPDLRDDSWKGHSGHDKAHPYDPNDTRHLNDLHRESELEIARKVEEYDRRRAAKETA